MSAHAALLQTIINTSAPLRSIANIRIRLVKKTTSSTKQTSLKNFVDFRLPVLKYHNPALKVEITRSQGSAGAGIEVQKGQESYVLGFQQLRDDEIFSSILALDKAQDENAAAVAGVTKGKLPTIEVNQPAKKKKAVDAAAPTAAATPAPSA